MTHPFAERLQATYLPEHMSFAFWGAPDLDQQMTSLGLTGGTSTVCRLAVPIDGRVKPTDVCAQLLDIETAVGALRCLDVARPELAESVLAWMRVVESGEHEQLPTAAHAALRRDDTAIRSAASTVRLFIEATQIVGRIADAGIRATLRPYQVQGVHWLTMLPGGGILADEMGLGKTLQAISMIAVRAADGPHLVICPTSVLGNWRREIERFAPNMPQYVHHGSARTFPPNFAAGTVVLTSYSVLRSDIEQFENISWSSVIFDEAQQIKNSTSKITRAAIRLRADTKVAMTGTPVENRLDDLYSLFRVVNPNVLGIRARFRRRFAVPIESGRSTTAAARLAAVIDPYILRRTKADVAKDLPPKQFSNVNCALTVEQASLYRAAVSDAFDTGLGSGFARRGNVLALLTTLKQVCNHPAQVTGDVGAGSGKLDRVTDMLAEIVDSGERALIFTQYRTMGEILSTHLGTELGLDDVPFLHGGLSTTRRDQLVDAFQTDEVSPPILVLSLRAAGFGLNLTRASHVIHYDRWWNPAVEDQATDRAHRIGQTRTVTVHTLVTGGTIEDHVDAMHRSKRSVAESISGNIESTLADLPDTELRGVLELGDAVII
ncbi:SNF2 family DNA or RNA helicase [Rhodococcus sp. 27YEA15]|uniref:DEAD/DEAH box helicase n=1 Tax=Rhodococcus sp. 27YEA15 TaxID=3156259 RepID=UPI003C7BA6E2